MSTENERGNVRVPERRARGARGDEEAQNVNREAGRGSHSSARHETQRLQRGDAFVDSKN